MLYAMAVGGEGFFCNWRAKALRYAMVSSDGENSRMVESVIGLLRWLYIQITQ